MKRERSAKTQKRVVVIRARKYVVCMNWGDRDIDKTYTYTHTHTHATQSTHAQLTLQTDKIWQF